jgi:hypothetical protein
VPCAGRSPRPLRIIVGRDAPVQPPSFRAPVPYPARPQLRPLSEFAGTASARPGPVVQARVEVFIIERYAVAGRALPELDPSGWYMAALRSLRRYNDRITRRTSRIQGCSRSPWWSG